MSDKENVKLVTKSASPNSNPASPTVVSPVQSNTNPSNPPKISTPKK